MRAVEVLAVRGGSLVYRLPVEAKWRTAQAARCGCRTAVALWVGGGGPSGTTNLPPVRACLLHPRRPRLPPPTPSRALSFTQFVSSIPHASITVRLDSGEVSPLSLLSPLQKDVEGMTAGVAPKAPYHRLQ